MLDRWDNEAVPVLPWYRRVDVRWGLCTSLMLVVGFFLGWSTTWLRDAELRTVYPTVLQHPDPFVELKTTSVQVDETAAGLAAPLPGPMPTAVSQNENPQRGQGS